MKREKRSEKKKKNNTTANMIMNTLLIFSLLFFVGIRLYNLLPGWGTVLDYFGYYGSAMIEKKQAEPRLSSGLAYAYTQNLSNFMNLLRNQREFVAVYHVLQQAAAMVMVYFGCKMLMGKAAACSGFILMASSPWLVDSMFVLSPENYYIFFWSVGILLVGFFYQKGRTDGWYRNNAGEGYLMVLGFYVGVLCIWHYFSFTLVLLLLFAMFENRTFVKEKKEMQKSLAEMAKMTGEEESIKEQDEIMPVSSQFFILAAGMFIGGYSTLMKYTGVTGNFIKEQFAWWTGQLAVMPQNGKWQDLYMWVPILISLSLVLGGLVQSLYDLIIGKSTLQTEKAEEKKPKSAPDFETEKELEAEHRIDGKVSFENESDFDIEISSEIRRDFDFEMAPETKDDFDVEIDDWQDGFRTEKKEPAMVKPVKVEEDADWKFDLEPADDENWRFDQEWEEDIPVEDEEDMEMEERKINYLENPLPLPKKHVKKIMDFEKDIVEAASKDDFDFAIGETDDFDV